MDFAPPRGARQAEAGQVHLRRANLDDWEAVAEVYLAARAPMTYIPPRPEFAPDSVRAWVRDKLLPNAEVHVASIRGQIVGFLALDDDRLEQLYLRPGDCRTGTGKRLLDLAKTSRPRGLELWVLEANTGAIRFYEREGFVTVERTDGANAMERIPDRRMVFRPMVITS